MLKKSIVQATYMVVGCILMAIAINVFFSPVTISTGGASGVGIIVEKIFKIPVSITVLVINIPLFVISLKLLGLKFCAKALIGTGLLILFIQLTSSLTNYEYFSFKNDMLIASVFGGILSGAGMSLVFKAGGSTGGTDLLAQIIYKKRPMKSIGQILLILDSLVIITTMIAKKSVLCGLYSIIAIYMSKQTLDTLFEGVNYTKVINIISQKGEEISKYIMQELERGVTSIKCVGEYTKEEYSYLIVVATKPQVAEVKSIVKKISPTSFIYISSANEVLGTGFKDNI